MILSLINQKGGVGKTTTTQALAVAFSELGKKVLCIDNDPQANLTICSGFSETTPSISEMMCDGVSFGETVLKTKHYDLIPASSNHYDSEMRLVDLKNREYVLFSAIRGHIQDYDMILIDCQPSLGLLTINALACSDEIIVPVNADYLSTIGLQKIEDTLEKVRLKINPSIKINGLIPTIFDMRTNIAKESLIMLNEHFKHKVYRKIPKSTRVKEAVLMGQSILETEPWHEISFAYKEIAREIINE